MKVIFKAKTREGYMLKTLAEILQSNIKTACFNITKTDITLRMMDNNRTILLDLQLDSDNFSIYRIKDDEKLCIGINLTHLHKMLKTVKKRDSVELFIDELYPTDLGIKIIPKENNRVTTSSIKIQNIQNLDIALPEGYDKPIIVPSSEFQKMCKGLTHISNVTHITSRDFIIRFSSDAGGVMKRYTEFGEPESSCSDDDEDEKVQKQNEYEEDFDTEQLTRITKLSGLNANMQIYPKNGLPLLFRSAIGGLGKISIYLKSKNLQEVDSHTVEEEN